jgi:hypothetical protein
MRGILHRDPRSTGRLGCVKNLPSQTITVNGNFGTPQLSPVPSTWPNWQCVQSNTGGTDYVYDTANGLQHDQYTTAPPSLPSGAIIASVEVHDVSEKEIISGSFAVTSAPMCNSYYGAATALITTYIDYWDTWTTNPATGNAWKVSDLSSLLVGVGLTASSINHAWGSCTYVYAVVNYTVPSVWVAHGDGLTLYMQKKPFLKRFPPLGVSFKGSCQKLLPFHNRFPKLKIVQF